MNTPSENAYYELMSGDRINFIVKETKEVEYDFKITPEIMNQFNQWKVDIFETTDTQPIELEMLEWFKKLGTPSSSGGLEPKIEVIEIKMIDINEDK
jgi:hypothetical protein